MRASVPANEQILLPEGTFDQEMKFSITHQAHRPGTARANLRSAEIAYPPRCLQIINRSTRSVIVLERETRLVERQTRRALFTHR